jgi:hypothetical protein
MADPKVSAAEGQEIRAILEEVEASGAADAAVELVSVEGTKDAFCKSWPIVKEVLAFLKDFAPPGVNAAIGLVIRGGDKVFDRICPQ